MSVHSAESKRCDNRGIREFVLAEAAFDYKFLLSRGYPSSSALALVTQRYVLSSDERLLLFRCVHSFDYVYNALRKIMCCSNGLCRDETLVIDFYNVLLTTMAMIENDDVYLCDDCLVRDLRGSKLRPGERQLLSKAFKIIAEVLADFKCFKSIVVVADKSVSHSLDDVREFTKVLATTLNNCNISYLLAEKPDSKVIELSQQGAVVASTDYVITEKVSRILPITTVILNKLRLKPCIDFAKLFGYTCPHCS